MSRFNEAGRTERPSPSILHAAAAGTRPVSEVCSGPWPAIEVALGPGSPLWTPPKRQRPTHKPSGSQPHHPPPDHHIQVTASGPSLPARPDR